MFAASSNPTEKHHPKQTVSTLNKVIVSTDSLAMILRFCVTGSAPIPS